MARSLSPGSRFGVFEVQSLLGEGGMGAVFRARDTQLGRDVAVKVLLPEVADNPERLARFRREAQVLAALNHPHIAAIYGLEEHEGVSALIIELVDGDDLAQRIGGGALPMREALRIAAQIAEALEAAHEQGIVHRDLKPANIKVRPDGMVKVLDFGLAKAITSGSGISSRSSASSVSPTITSPVAMTGVGIILGTAAYMSPEQARGGSVDRRADLWAFGAILCEMLTGRRLFEGATVSDTLASVLKSEPDWSLLPPATPAAIRRLLRRCLEKDRRERLDSAADARLEIQEGLTSPVVDAIGAAAARPARTARLPWAIAAVTTVAAAALLATLVSRTRAPAPADQPLMEFEITAPDGTTFGAPTSSFRVVAVSPDGRQLAMVAGPRDARRMLWIRPLASNTPRVIAGTEDASHPFWSPDGRWVGFTASGKLKRVELTGAQPQTLGETNRQGGAFSGAGVLLLTRNNQPLLRVPPAGGNPEPAFQLDAARKEAGQYDPIFLPDDKHLIYLSAGSEMGLVYASLDGSVRKFLFPQRSSPAAYAPDPAGAGGWLLYSAGGQLLARRFDPASGDVAAEPSRIADNVIAGPTFSVSPGGVLTFRRNNQAARELVWLARDGKPLGTAGDVGSGTPRARISPGGDSIVVQRTTDGNADIWVQSVTAGEATRLTFEESADTAPIWSADGQRVYYASARDGRAYLVDRPANGLGAERVLLQGESGLRPQPLSISRDGRWLVVRSGGAGQSAISFLSLTDGKTVPFQETASVGAASLSPDGRWIAYEMRTTGDASEVFVRGVPAALNGAAVDAKRQLSNGGAGQPIWRADGQEILYTARDGTVMRVSVDSKDGVFRPRTPAALFKIDGTALDVTADGERILFARTVSENDPAATVIVNWTKLLRQ